MASKGRKLAKLIVNDSGRQENTVLDGDYVKLPVGTTAERPTGVAGYIRFNTDEASLEQFDGTSWTEMAKPPIISALSYSGSVTAVGLDGGETVTISGTNFTAGVNVQFGTTWATAVTRTNSTSLSVTVPALTAGDYDVVVINGDGMQATLTDGLSVNAAPAFTTAAGSLGEIQVDQAITTITLVATEDDSGAITYAVTTGSLPTGLSLSGADITGTPTGYTAETTANFTITATDDENQTVTRNFSLTVLVGFYDYEITNAVQLDSTASTPKHLDRTPSADGNNDTFTLSLWVKRGKISSTQQFYSSRVDNSNGFFGYFGGNDAIEFYHPAYNYVAVTTTTAVYRDEGAWYHIVYAIDTTQATASDRAKLYVNGELVTDRSGNYPRLDEDQFYHRSGVKQTIGTNPDQSYGTDGYVANVYSIDGQQLAASDFGEWKNGVWVAKEYTGTYGSQGFHLDFSNSSNIGEDQSGNNNDFAYDTLNSTNLVPDTPTNNFATLSTLCTPSGHAISKANLAYDAQDNDGFFVPFGMRGGKWYWELLLPTTTNNFGFGIVDDDVTTQFKFYKTSTAGGLNNNGEYSGEGYGWFGGTSTSYKNDKTSAAAYGPSSLTAGDLLACAYDGDNGTITFYRNGTSQGTAYTGISTDKTFYPFFHTWGAGTANVNFGQDSTFRGRKTEQNNTDSNGIGDFYYTPPTGYLALCNENLPNNTFDLNQGEKPSDHFQTVLYSGTGASQNITGLNFAPDLVWIKSRGTTDSHVVANTIIGANSFLSSNLTSPDNTANNCLTAFNSDGFTVGSQGIVNDNTSTYVAWCWKAGGTPVSNTDGSITSSVSANTTAGFSIISYAGNSTAGATIGHGLNSTPEMIVVKNRDHTNHWQVYHPRLGTTQFIQFNTDVALNQSTYPMFNSTLPNDSVFTVGNIDHTNTSGYNYIAYAWHSVPGFSKVGSYTGNGSIDGPFIYTGFKPAFIMLKRTDSGNYWLMLDNKRKEYNPNALGLYASGTDVETNFGNNRGIDFLSNGFKHRDNVNSNNAFIGTYIYIAFAEDPFKYGNAK